MRPGTQQGIRAKLERADEHLETLKREIDAFIDGKPYEYWTKADYHAGSYSVHITINDDPPPRLSVICGDYVQSLRSALDHLVCGAVRKVTKRTAFPIHTDSDDFLCGVVLPARRKRSGPLTGLDPGSALFTMIEYVQPHNGPHGYKVHPLFMLRELSNMDKHRAILARVAAHRTVETPVGINAHHVRIGEAQYATGRPLKNGAKVAWGTFLVTGAEPHVEMDGDFPVEIAFGDEFVRFDGLELLRQIVRETIAQAYRLLELPPL